MHVKEDEGFTSFSLLLSWASFHGLDYPVQQHGLFYTFPPSQKKKKKLNSPQQSSCRIVSELQDTLTGACTINCFHHHTACNFVWSPLKHLLHTDDQRSSMLKFLPSLSCHLNIQTHNLVIKWIKYFYPYFTVREPRPLRNYRLLTSLINTGQHLAVQILFPLQPTCSAVASLRLNQEPVQKVILLLPRTEHFMITYQTKIIPHKLSSAM